DGRMRRGRAGDDGGCAGRRWRAELGGELEGAVGRAADPGLRACGQEGRGGGGGGRRRPRRAEGGAARGRAAAGGSHAARGGPAASGGRRRAAWGSAPQARTPWLPRRTASTSSHHGARAARAGSPGWAYASFGMRGPRETTASAMNGRSIALPRADAIAVAE